MLVPDINIYDALKGMLGEEKARQVVAGIKEQVAHEIEAQKNDLATKGDVLALKEDISKLDIKISETKSEMIKWTFTFVMGALVINIAAIIASFLALANMLRK